jgi:hypothetical protein
VAGLGPWPCEEECALHFTLSGRGFTEAMSLSEAHRPMSPVVIRGGIQRRAQRLERSVLPGQAWRGCVQPASSMPSDLCHSPKRLGLDDQLHDQYSHEHPQEAL